MRNINIRDEIGILPGYQFVERITYFMEKWTYYLYMKSSFILKEEALKDAKVYCHPDDIHMSGIRRN